MMQRSYWEYKKESLMHGDNPVDAKYFSTSGGFTEAAKELCMVIFWEYHHKEIRIKLAKKIWH